MTAAPGGSVIGGGFPVEQGGSVMATYFDFRSETVAALHGFTDDPVPFAGRLPP